MIDTDLVNGIRRMKDRGMSSVGTSEDGEENSSMQDDDDDFHIITDLLSTVKPPQVRISQMLLQNICIYILLVLVFCCHWNAD